MLTGRAQKGRRGKKRGGREMGEGEEMGEKRGEIKKAAGSPEL